MPKSSLPLVSIIVPFYNPYPIYFTKLLNSLREQSYGNLEIVLIDDGSNIEINKIAKDFASSSKNTLLKTQLNSGVASARQSGIELSTGELIIHADADDIVPKFAIENMVRKLIETDSDIVIGQYSLLYQSIEKRVDLGSENDYWLFVKGLLQDKYHGSLCNKLLKRELYDQVKFDTEVSYMEDKLILSEILYNGPYKISFLNNVVYNYRQNNLSVTNTLSIKSIKSAAIVNNKIIKLYYKIYESCVIEEIAKNSRVFQLIQHAKLGINLYVKDDAWLIKSKTIPRKKRIVIWLLSKNRMNSIKLITAIEKKYKSRYLYNSILN